MPKQRHTRFDCNPGCAVEATVSLIDGKWKGVILSFLFEGTARFNGLRRRIPCVTARMLTAQLRELEADGLISRTVYAQVPPRVEYDLTDLGRSLSPVIATLRAWGADHLHLFTGEVSDAEPPPPDGIGPRRADLEGDASRPPQVTFATVDRVEPGEDGE